MRKVIFLSSLIFLVLPMLVTSCRPKIPNQYIQPDELEDILYDYSIGDAMVRNDGGSDTMRLRVLKLSMLKKRGYTEAELDSSLLYYMRHAELLQKVYANLADRLTNEAHAQGMSGMEVTAMVGASGDTASIWSGERAVILSRYKPFNLHTFAIKADTSFYKGDNIILAFNTQLIGRSVNHGSMAMLAVTFGNDSVASQTAYMSSSSSYNLKIADRDRLGIKAVRGFFMLNATSPASDDVSDKLGLLLVSNIQLVKMHESKEQKQRNDSIRNSLSDSMQNVRQMPVGGINPQIPMRGGGGMTPANIR